VSSAEQIAEAYRGLTTDYKNPPRPWAYLSHVGKVTHVGELGGLTIRGYVDTYAFSIDVDGRTYRVMVQEVEHAP